MMKTTLVAMLGLAAALTLVGPSQAHAGVVIGVQVGPVFPRPVYGPVYVAPRPYVYPVPYAYRPVYMPRWRAYRDYDRHPYWWHERYEHHEHHEFHRDWR